jgi:hypothetical protein
VPLIRAAKAMRTLEHSSSSERAPVRHHARGVAGTCLLGFLTIVVCVPPILGDVEFASRGIKLDQVLLGPSMFMLLLAAPRRVWAAARHPVGMALAVFAGCSLLSSLWSALFVDGANPLAATAAAWGSVRAFLVFSIAYALAVRAAPVTRVRVFKLVVLLGLVIVGVATAQLMQLEPLYSLTVEYYPRKADFAAILESLNVGRAYGTFDGQPNIFGAFIVLTVAIAGAFLVNARRPVERWILVACLGWLGWGLAISWSRGSYAAAMVAVAVLVWHAGPRRAAKLIVSLAVSGVVIYFTLPEHPRERFVQLFQGRGYEGDSIFGTRLPIWEANLALFLQNPLLGVRGVAAAPLDSLYIGLLVVNGVVGAIVFLVGIVLVLRSLGAQRTVLAVGLAAATVAWLVNGLSIPVFFGERIQEVYWLLCGVALAPVKAFGSTHSAGARPTGRVEGADCLTRAGVISGCVQRP